MQPRPVLLTVRENTADRIEA